MPSTCEWVVWYDDGSSFSNLDGDPEEAPRWGVLCVAIRSSDNGRNIWHGTDFFIWTSTWINVDSVGLIDYLANEPGAYKVCLIGKHVQRELFDRIYRLADEDPRLPPRSSRAPQEDWPKQL